MRVQNTDQFVCAVFGKPFKSNCSWRKATGNHLYICTCHVYDDASAMTVSSRTCLRAENSSSSSASSIKCFFKIYKANIYVVSKFQTPLAYHSHNSNCISRTTTLSKSKLILLYKILGLCLNSVSKNLEQYP